MTVNKKSLLLAGALAVVASLTLAGCTSGAATDSGGDTAANTLTIWLDAERVDALKDSVAAYSEKTGVKVKLVSKDNATLKDDFIQQVPTGKGPDITMGAHDWLGELVTNGVVSPIELGDKAGDFLDVAISASTYDGQVYELPYAVENLALLRNADLVPEAASNFDDMIAKGTAAGAKYPFLVEQGVDGNPFHLYPFQTAFDAPVFGTDAAGGYDATKLELGNAGGEAFATWLGSQGKNGTGVFNTEITGDIAKAAFTSGEAAFWLTGPWNVGAAVDAGINLAVDPIASPGASAAQPFAGVKGFFVSEQSKNKVAANDFLVNYMATEKVQTALFESGQILPALKASAKAASADPVIAGFATVGADAVPMPAIPAMGQVWEFWGIAQAAVINGADPTTTWQKLTADVQGAIG
ncbi:MAG: extracellular solute-binding protein [Cryobacterium sp.]|uniref:sugar ABC transporter substrate-binding protein n=1 Tax=unclassified Cryobacterium TaxID=2649013 RepID=UPI0018CAD7B0|nr:MULTISPECIES: extracellular solute-binding protein [unclassified Cryobacterium]MCY7403029.1 extracellular solute-binding protein [Cryobacterium sp.]MEC5153279.1 arabinogalactan oligomer/maltooligosaccharide transport system substrate-binding protein [Cryobacterium sp. CAN_C3]